jgi:hypothetical protein
MQTYKARNGNIQYKPSFKQLEHVIASDNATGFCLACGAENDGVEPDARKYTCESCHAPKVFGAEQLVFMNLFH